MPCYSAIIATSLVIVSKSATPKNSTWNIEVEKPNDDNECDLEYKLCSVGVGVIDVDICQPGLL